MRIITKQFHVFNYDELTELAKEKVVGWYTRNLNEDILIEEMALFVEDLEDQLKEKHSMKIDITFETCSAWFISHLEIHCTVGDWRCDIRDTETIEDPEKIYDKVWKAISKQLDYVGSREWAIEQLKNNNLEFTANGKFYKDAK